MNKAKILVVDDEIKITEFITSYLEKSNFDVQVVYNGIDAVSILNKEKFDLIILDLMLPDISGEEICKNIRNSSNIPIIMLTAKVDEKSIVDGLNMGADDYVLKPFSPKQLVARVNTILRRTNTEKTKNTDRVSFNSKDLEIFYTKNEVYKFGNLVNLTPKEYKLLITLTKYKNKIFTREELIESAFGLEFEGYDRTIDVHIKNLRHKIETDTKYPIYIITVHSIGYKFGGEIDEN